MSKKTIEKVTAPVQTGPQIDVTDLVAATRDRMSKAYAEADEWKAAYAGLYRELEALKASMKAAKTDPVGDAVTKK
jgi:hypothetical protein